MNDCRTCVHNSYLKLPNEKDWVSCGHPITRAKSVRWESGDPAMVNFRTGDVHVRDIGELANCPTWQPANGAAK